MYLVAVVGPGSELHVTVLVVKGEPSDVYLASALEDARRNVQATAVMRDHHVCLVRSVETLIRTNVFIPHIINHRHRSRSRFRSYLIIPIVSRDFISSIFYTDVSFNFNFCNFYFIFYFIVYWQEQDECFTLKWFLPSFLVKHLGNWFCYVDID